MHRVYIRRSVNEGSDPFIVGLMTATVLLVDNGDEARVCSCYILPSPFHFHLGKRSENKLPIMASGASLKDLRREADASVHPPVNYLTITAFLSPEYEHYISMDDSLKK